MTTFAVAHEGADYRIEIDDDQFVMLQQDRDGDWTVEAQMTVRAAEVLASINRESISRR